MSTRRGGSLPTIISLVIFIVLTAAGIITSVVFFSQSDRAKKDLAALESQYDQIVARSELQNERVTGALRETRNESLVSSLLAQTRELKRATGGNAEAPFADLMERIEGRGAGALLSQIDQLETRVASLESELADERARRATAQADASTEAERVRTIQTNFDDAVRAAQNEIGTYGGGVDDLRQRVDEFTRRVLAEREAERAQTTALIADKDERIAELSQNALVLRDQIARLRGEGTVAGIRPVDEYALIDGAVVGRDASDGQVVIDLGAGDKLQIGQIFSVYGEPSELRPDPRTGEYEPGKAAIEVIRVGPESSRARVIRSSRGNPVVRGDLIASPVYDPNKVYRFVVFGTFDVNGDGVRSELERLELETLIRRWGGEIQNEIQGDTDFLVLGAKPDLPPPPSSTAPRDSVLEYVRLQRKVGDYDELLRQARASSLPVLNENRLRTLIGAFPD